MTNRVIFFLFPLIFFSHFCFIWSQINNIQKEKNDLQILNLKGLVKSLREIPHNALIVNGQINKSEILYPLSRLFYSVLHIPAEMGDEYGELDGINDKIMVQNSYITFNEMGNVIEHEIYQSENSILINCSYKYDSNNKLIESIFNTTDKGGWTFKWFYTNDSIGNFNELKSDLEPDKYFKLYFKYDNKGNKIEKKGVLQNANDNYNYVWIFEYDNKAHIIVAKNSIGLKYTYKYNENGLMIEEDITYFDLQWEIKSTFKYNEIGDLISIVNEKENIMIKYEYDKNGNWINKITFMNDKPQYFVEREIVYY